jgi:hypothetical protein
MSRLVEELRQQIALSEYSGTVRLDLSEARELLAHIERLNIVVECASKIRHWHDREPDGMVVSRDSVMDLWAALSELDEATQKPHSGD